MVGSVRRHLLEFGGHLAVQIPIHLRLRLVGDVHAHLRLGAFGNQAAGNVGFGDQILLVLVRAPQQQMPLLHGLGQRIDIGFRIAGILRDMVERGLRGISEILVRLRRSHLRVHGVQQRLRGIRTIQYGAVRHSHTACNIKHVLQEQWIDGYHTIHLKAILLGPHGTHDLAGTREIRSEVHIADIRAQFVGEQHPLLGGELHHRLAGLGNLRIRDERLQAQMAALHGDHAKRPGQAAGRTGLRIGLRQNQIVARSVIGMAVRAEHAGQQLSYGVQRMHGAVELCTVGLGRVERIGDLVNVWPFRRLDLTGAVVDHLVGNAQRLLRILQTRKGDRAILHVDIAQIDVLGDLRQLRQRLRGNILQRGDRGTDRGNIIPHIRNMRCDRP